jgi:hypothetical protein
MHYRENREVSLVVQHEILRNARKRTLRGSLQAGALCAWVDGFLRAVAFWLTAVFAEGYGVFGLGKVLA